MGSFLSHGGQSRAVGTIQIIQTAFFAPKLGHGRGIGFVITHDAAVTVAVAGGATLPEVKERGWFPWAASLGQCWSSDAPALGFFAHKL